MVHLTDDYRFHKEAFEAGAINVPQYSQMAIDEETNNAPVWVHFGGGNLFRCFHAAIAQSLLNQGELKSGVVVAETYDDEVVSRIYRPYNNRILQVITKADGQFEKHLLASVAESYFFNQSNQTDWQAMMAIFAKPSLQFATFSITEKGYNLWQSNGNLLEMVAQDIENGPEAPLNNMAGVTALLYHRYQNGATPIAMISTDNFSQNGDRLKKSVLTVAQGWVAKGHVPAEFIDYLTDTKQVSFPLSMIDRITPNPSQTVADQLAAAGFEDNTILHTTKGTNIAPFGNTEETHYLVIEDAFPNGRPDLTKAGVYLVSRDVVNDVDEMKVTTCLNPLHTSLAVFGCLLGYQSISAEMQNPDLVQLIKQIGYHEGLPVVKDPGIINPKQFIDEVVNKRLPNPFIPDTPQRIASDTSQKMAIRYGVTLQHYVDRSDLTPTQLHFIPLTIAAWCRYLVGLDDNGAAFDLSPDPLLSELQADLKDLQLGQAIDAHALLQPILSNKTIFGLDLYQIELGTRIETLFSQMMAEKGAIAATLHTLIEKEAE